MFALWYLYYGYKELKNVEDQKIGNSSGQNLPTPVLFQKTPPKPVTPSTSDVKSPSPVPTPSEPKRPSPPKQLPSQPTVKPPPQLKPQTPVDLPVQPKAQPPVQPPVQPKAQPPVQPKAQPSLQPNKPVEVEKAKIPETPESRLMKGRGNDESPAWQPFPSPEDKLLNPALYQRRT